eukprot:Skav235938  [mRNA]  locus=scaffold4666:6024:7911:- [translate_table: standard]
MPGRAGAERLPRAVVEQLRRVHLAQLDELSELRTRIRSSRTAHLARQAAGCLEELLQRHKEISRVRDLVDSGDTSGLELAEAEKGCTNGEGHLSVLRRIAEKLSSEAQDLPPAVSYSPLDLAASGCTLIRNPPAVIG